jgi:hypothetical protein
MYCAKIPYSKKLAVIMTKYRYAIYGAILLLACFSVYLNSLPNAFVSDDTAIVSSALQPLASSVTHLHSLLQTMLFRVFGANPMPFRFVNILLHAATAILLYEAVSRLINRKIGFFSALLFAVHPITTESVAWISGGVYPQYGALLLGSLLLYIESKRKPVFLWYSLAAFTTALLSSEKAVLWILLLASYEWFYGNIKKQLVPLVYFVIVTVLAVVIRLPQVAQRSIFTEGFSAYALSAADPIRHIASTIGIYLDTILWPARLSAYHSTIGVGAWTFVRWYSMTTILAVFLISTAIAKKKEGFWISLFLIPTLFAIVPATFASSYAERYVYLGSAGIIVLVVYLLTKGTQALRFSQNATAVLFILLSIALGIRTIYRNADWRNERTFVFATLRDSPNNPKVHNMAADIYVRENNFAKAKEELAKAISLSPTYYPAYFNLGLLFENEGNFTQAETLFQKALTINPSFEVARIELEQMRQFLEEK